MATITMYATGWCPYCARARALFEHKGVTWTELDTDDAARRTEMIERSGRRTVPQIFIGDHHVGGCDELYALDAAGGHLTVGASGARCAQRNAKQRAATIAQLMHAACFGRPRATKRRGSAFLPGAHPSHSLEQRGGCFACVLSCDFLVCH